MKDYRKIMQSLTLEELKEYASDMPEEQLETISKEDLIDHLMQDDGEGFGEHLEAGNGDYGEMMHPDESDDEFSEHEDLDDD